MDRWKSWTSNLNFYRIHILAFTIFPVIFATILYTSNGTNHIDFVDCLFLCVSSMTICGLATVELSLLTPWQQALLFIQMCIGNPVFVSWLIVLVRKYYFAKKFKYITISPAQDARTDSQGATPSWTDRIKTAFHASRDTPSDESEDELHRPRLRPDMIRRVGEALRPVNPSGWISEGTSVVASPSSSSALLQQDISPHEAPQPSRKPLAQRSDALPPAVQRKRGRRISDPGTPSRVPSLERLPRHETLHFPRTQTVEFAPAALRRRGHHPLDLGHLPSIDSQIEETDEQRAAPLRRSSFIGSATSRRASWMHGAPYQRLPPVEDFGGFPMPHEIITTLLRKFFPSVHSRLTRTLTLPATTTITSQHTSPLYGARSVSYLGFDATVGRNSAFRHLTSEQLEELGGVEYRAPNALVWIVGSYHLGLQILGLVIVAPYMSASQWQANFEPPQLHSYLAPPWFSLFQVVSAYTNTGMSLVDQSMIPFQRAYLMISVMSFLVLAGNTAFPVFLRFTIWMLSKCIPPELRSYRTLQFLLDHPRRCFIYLFPSHQTWFLLTIVIGLTFTDWFFFMILDVNTHEIDSLPFGTRCIVGLMQAVAVRAAGFSSVALYALAPAVKFLYVIMMYVSVYPIAMSVRTTNVYEDQSLGIYSEEDSDSEDEFKPTGSRVGVWGRYLTMHIRKQLAFDMWWIALAIFIVCIIEQPNLENPKLHGWFNIFNVVFELVSAYGTVGLSLGAPTTNASFCAVFRPLSKLIICAVMLRGRHRGLPVAIDRAVIVPNEFKNPPEPDISL